MPTRRTVLVAGLAALGTAAAAAAGFALLEQPPLPDPVDRVLDRALDADARWAALGQHLRARFWYLDLPDGTIEAFLAAAKQYGRLPTSDKRLEGLRKNFLMSTDFFLKGEDEARPVLFVAWYDPYITPCWNPLARRIDQG